MVQSWQRHWDRIIPFFAFPAAVRKIVYTTNAIESLHSGVRKSIRLEAATKLIWLALRHLTAKWKNPPVAWAAARVQFAIQFGRFRLGVTAIAHTQNF